MSIVAAVQSIESKWYILMVLNGAVAGIIGFLLPTWHILHRNRTREETRDSKIRFILPSNLPSTFAVKENRKSGIEIDGSRQWIEIKVPPTRVVNVQSMQVFEEYLIGDAVDAEGNHIPIEYVDENQEGMSMLRGCGKLPDGVKFFVIGSREFQLTCLVDKKKHSLEEMLETDHDKPDNGNPWSRLGNREETETEEEEGELVD